VGRAPGARLGARLLRCARGCRLCRWILASTQMVCSRCSLMLGVPCLAYKCHACKSPCNSAAAPSCLPPSAGQRQWALLLLLLQDLAEMARSSLQVANWRWFVGMPSAGWLSTMQMQWQQAVATDTQSWAMWWLVSAADAAGAIQPGCVSARTVLAGVT
jgi:hypothetical protein